MRIAYRVTLPPVITITKGKTRLSLNMHSRIIGFSRGNADGVKNYRDDERRRPTNFASEVRQRALIYFSNRLVYRPPRYSSAFRGCDRSGPLADRSAIFRAEPRPGDRFYRSARRD